MKFRIKAYLSSPRGIWCRLKRDVPYWIKGKSYYAESARALQYERPHVAQCDRVAIDDYWRNRQIRTSKSVVYTCVTNGYDSISEIASYGYVNPNWDYICFTDEQTLIDTGRLGIWEIRPLAFAELDNTRNNRWHKIHPHKLLPNYNESIYLDANIDILSPYLFDQIKSLNQPFILPRHPSRNCIYDEYDNVLAEFMDDPRRVIRELKLIRRSGMPKSFGLTENNILYRRHNENAIISLMEDWWEMIRTYSRRDQLSLMWLLWKRNANVAAMTLPNARTLTSDFCVFRHTGRK